MLVDDSPHVVRGIGVGGGGAAAEGPRIGRGAIHRLPPAAPDVRRVPDVAPRGRVGGTGRRVAVGNRARHRCPERAFVRYLNFGGYPEVALVKEVQDNPARFVKSDIIDKGAVARPAEPVWHSRCAGTQLPVHDAGVQHRTGDPARGAFETLGRGQEHHQAVLWIISKRPS